MTCGLSNFRHKVENQLLKASPIGTQGNVPVEGDALASAMIQAFKYRGNRIG